MRKKQKRVFCETPCIKIDRKTRQAESIWLTPPQGARLLIGSVWSRQTWVLWVPFKNARFLLLSTTFTWKRLWTDTDLLLLATRTANKLFRGTNNDDLERSWNLNGGFFSNFWRFQAATLFALKLLEVDQDDLHIKFSA